jgi:hypothetical protein
VAVAPAAHLGGASRGDDAAARNGERADDRAARIERENLAVVENEVGGYFSEPFSPRTSASESASSPRNSASTSSLPPLRAVAPWVSC